MDPEKLLVGIAILSLIVILWYTWRRCPRTYFNVDDRDLLVTMPTYYPGIRGHQDSWPHHRIPARIIQTNENEKVPISFYLATTTLLRDNRNYEYMYFTDTNARKFIEENFDTKVLTAYDDLLPGAYKADLFRYCALYVLGGVYIDMGMVSLGEGLLDHTFKRNDEFISAEDNFSGGVYNAFIASVPGHVILKEAIDMVVDNVVHRRYTTSPLAVTGPLLLAKAYEKVVKTKPKQNSTMVLDQGNVRLLGFCSERFCEGGIIRDNDVNLLLTRYTGYRRDQKMYSSKPHYSVLWRNGMIYRN